MDHEPDRLRSVISAMRTRAVKPLRDKRVEDIRRGVARGEFKLCEHTILLGFEALESGVPLEDVLELSETYAALMRERHTHLTGGDDITHLSLAALHVAEEEAQALMEVAETRYHEDRTPHHLAVALRTRAAYRMASDRYERKLRAEQVRQ